MAMDVEIHQALIHTRDATIAPCLPRARIGLPEQQFPPCHFPFALLELTLAVCSLLISP